jgi:TetR/AcrR family transcriptional repressor of nem operon
MGRPRGFDEDEVVRAAAKLFATRAYDGVSVDDLVAHLGVHRNSLYKTFGSKRGLYLAALRWYLTHEVRPLVGEEPFSLLLAAGPALDLLLLAAVERAPVDPDVADEIGAVLSEFDRTLGADDTAAGLTALLLGLRLRARMGTEPDQLAAAVAHRLNRHPH